MAVVIVFPDERAFVGLTERVAERYETPLAPPTIEEAMAFQRRYWAGHGIEGFIGCVLPEDVRLLSLLTAG